MIRITLREYLKVRASWPRGPLGTIVPEEYLPGVLIVAGAPAEIAPPILDCARCYAAHARS